MEIRNKIIFLLNLFLFVCFVRFKFLIFYSWLFYTYIQIGNVWCTHVILHILNRIAWFHICISGTNKLCCESRILNRNCQKSNITSIPKWYLVILIAKDVWLAWTEWWGSLNYLVFLNNSHSYYISHGWFHMVVTAKINAFIMFIQSLENYEKSKFFLKQTISFWFRNGLNKTTIYYKISLDTSSVCYRKH